MVSISHVVEDIVKHRPYLSESLAAGIINVSSLARQLQPDVERALQKGVNTGAIVMALNRLAPSGYIVCRLVIFRDADWPATVRYGPHFL